jgi:hypothetical protein
MRNNLSVASATADTTSITAANSSSSSSSISTSIANRRNRVKTPTKTIRSRIKRKSIVDTNIHNTTNIDTNNNIDTIDFNMNQSQQISELLSSVISNNCNTINNTHHHSSLSTQLMNSSSSGPSSTSSLLVSTSTTAPPPPPTTTTTTTTTSMSISDQVSILILILLYTLQGIPMGLSASIPVILKEKGASYGSLSLFSLVSLPFSLKLLWAPLVDSYYIKSFGRRKTWLIPIQLITGIVMIIGSYHIQSWLGYSSSSSSNSSSGDGSSNSSDETTPSVTKLTIFFLFLYFLMATQDIAVDGWALTMLSRDSVGYASICNSIGQVLGIFIANQGFIALSDINWCKTYLNIAPLINLSDFMLFWGYIFIIITTLILIFKKEEIIKNNINDDLSSTNGETLFETCQQVLSILQLPAIKSFAFILLTYKIAFAPADAIFNFKLQVVIISIIICIIIIIFIIFTNIIIIITFIIILSLLFLL